MEIVVSEQPAPGLFIYPIEPVVPYPLSEAEVLADDEFFPGLVSEKRQVFRCKPLVQQLESLLEGSWQATLSAVCSRTLFFAHFQAIFRGFTAVVAAMLAGCP